MKNPAMVSIVVVTLDRIPLLRTCIESLVRQDYPAIEILVVDNGSTEDIQGMLQREFPNVRTLRLDTNRGFAGGNNRGMIAAQGTYVALLNNDATAAPGWVSAMVRVAERDPAIGAVGCIIRDGNQPDRLDSCGVGIALDGMSRQAQKGAPVPAFTHPTEILLPSGCACLYRVEALREAGMFDEAFFAYCEDTDLGLRLRRAGWRAMLAPDAVVTHYYSMTGGKFSLQKAFLVERNHFWVAWKNFPWPLLLLLPLATAWRYLLQAVLVLRGEQGLRPFVQKEGPMALAVTLFRAQLAALAGLPHALRERRRCRPVRALGALAMCRLLFQFRLPMYAILGGTSHAGDRPQ